jgi:N utilization substance protein A
MAITSANQLELLQTAEAVAREKMIDPALVVEAMEESLARAAKSALRRRDGHSQVSIDRKTGQAPPSPACAPWSRTKSSRTTRRR